jgi:hypothetical protein
MIPFDVNMNGKKRVGISFESLVWFFVVTAAATVVGELVYEKWVSPYLASLPNLPFGLSTQAPTAAALPPAQSASSPNGSGNVVQFPGNSWPNPNG